MAEFVGAGIEVGKCIAEPIKRQFNYLCCFNTNIQNLRDEAEKLNDAKVGVEGQVDAARRNIEVIVPRVETWLDDVNKIQENYMSTIEPEIQNPKSDCLAIKSRFSLSRKATKMAAAMKELKDDGKFGQIAHPGPPAAMASIPHGQTYELESRKHFEEEIMATLREKKVSMMGICGMGGVGKTTMANKIMSRARGESLFDEIVMVVVSQPVNMLRIQKEMAELLGLKLEVESLAARAHQLRTRLTNTKSILIILDDLWEALSLEELGIPDQKECTILLTSRNTDVFSDMSVENPYQFQMKILCEIEAWSLFKEKVGACANDPSLFPTPQDIVRECNGLPIALVTVGAALKDKKNKAIWENALEEIRSCNPDIPHFLAQVYNPLKLSYDFLESEPAKSIFLMCCLFPEDWNIHISNLGLYAWGLGMFEGITNLRATRNKVQASVEMLKSRSLLLDGGDEGFTKMHDVVRDVGTLIAAKGGLMNPNWPRGESNCTWISLFDAQKITLPEGSAFPNLRFLLIESLPLCDNFFESATKLHVLSIQYYTLRSLPHTIQLQKDLRTLTLYECNYLEDISVVGELVSLEILYCQWCNQIKELPIEIGRLNQLKLLNISYCWNLDTIAAGVISRLTRLEELTLIGSFRKWESGSSEGKSAALCELNSLSFLTTLRIQIQDTSLAAEQIHLPNLVEFNICIGFSSRMSRMRREIEMMLKLAREMTLNLKRDDIIGDWIYQLLRTTQRLDLGGEGSSKLVPLLPESQSLKRLSIFDNVKMTRLIDGRSSGPTTTVFPLLEFLCLENIDDIEEIHKGPISSDSFNNLSSIYIEYCHSLRSVFPYATGNDYLSQLKSLAIESCSTLEQVVIWKEEESEHHRRIPFARLGNLFLRNLPRLKTLCKGIDSTEFPLLSQTKIVKCPNLKSVVSSTENDDDLLHFFCKPDQAAFGRLEELVIDGYDSTISLWCDQIPIDLFTGLVQLDVFNCGNIKSLFSLSIARNLVNLRKLRIERCREMVKVIEDKVDEAERSPFIKLEMLRLIKLPKLKVFCDWRCALQFPLLTEMGIKKCPNLKSLVSSTENDHICSGAVNDADESLHLFCKSEAAFGRLEELVIDGYDSTISLWCDQIPIDLFTGLVDLTVSNCDNIMSLFSLSIARNLVNLRKLRIKSCREMVKVIEDKVDEAERSPFIKLEVLVLKQLPKLKAFCDWRCALQFPLLTDMEIVECPNLKRLVSSTENDHICSGAVNEHLFCKSEAAFGRLEYLEINGYENISSERSLSLWCNQISVDLFTRLVRLDVSNCGNIKSLFSPSIAGNLVNLKYLDIESCREMVKVVEDKVDEVERSSFIKLEMLRLTRLPKLKAFCDWRCALHLPSLRTVSISKCPEMERFSFGSLTTPNLNSITINTEDIQDYTLDLNKALFWDRGSFW